MTKKAAASKKTEKAEKTPKVPEVAPMESDVEAIEAVAETTPEKVTEKVVEKVAAKVTPKSDATLGEAVMVYTKSSSHWCGLLQPKIIEIQGMKFVEGVQVTGKVGHRLERKRTLIPLDHVASISVFASEDDMFSEPQPKNIRPLEEEKQPVSLTSHEGGHPDRHQGAGNGNRRHRHRNNRGPNGGGDRGGNGYKRGGGSDARFQEQYDSRRDRDFNR